MAVGAAPAVNLGRCNPYGAETGGPRRVLGGLYGPNSATTPDAGLPENVAQGEWRCQWPAVVRCRMVCRCGHTGQIMQLCSWHEEPVYRGEYAAGTIRRVRDTVMSRGHYEEISRRQSGTCPRCAFPSPGLHLEVRGRGFIHMGTDYAALHKDIEHMAWQLALEVAGGRRHGPRAHELLQKAEDACRTMDQGRDLGLIHNCPLTLVPVS